MAEFYVGEIRAFAFPYATDGWLPCDGQVLPAQNNYTLFSLLGATFGGDGVSNFALPDIRGRMLLGQGQSTDKSYSLGEKGGSETIALNLANLPAHSHALRCSSQAGDTGSPVKAVLATIQSGSLTYVAAAKTGKTGIMDADSISPAGRTGTLDNMSPFITMNYMIATNGLYPTFDGGGDDIAFLGEIKMFAFSRPPNGGWMPCDGRILQCNQHQGLFSLLGDAFGGDGKKTFALPDLRGTIPMYPSASAQKSGKRGGARTNTLNASHLPSHNHALNSDKEKGTLAGPLTNFWGATTTNYYTANAPDKEMDASVITPTGSSMPFDNMPPHLAVNFCICVKGMYPPRSY